MLQTAVFGSSRKPDEMRVPIFPEHIPWIDPLLRRFLVFESGYADRFGLSNDYLLQQGCRVTSREELFKHCELLILPKPVAEDLAQMAGGQTLWGWPHCVQQRAVAQLAIERRLTIIAWEAMHCYGANGEKTMHVFYKNNELAGYCAVHHVLQLTGIDGLYGPRRFVVVLGYGSVARGAIHALHNRGFNNILVLTRRPVHMVRDQHPDVYFSHLAERDNVLFVQDLSGDKQTLTNLLSRADLICNCVLQDTSNPLMFLAQNEVDILKPNSIIVDISCDEGMAFPFARPTTFRSPTFVVGSGVTYYAVDHTPTYLWSAASREISKAALPYLSTVMGGGESWVAKREVADAIEISDGVVRNQSILKYQGRAAEYPHQCV